MGWVGLGWVGLGQGLIRTRCPSVGALFSATRWGYATRGCPVARPTGRWTAPKPPRWHTREGDAAVLVRVARVRAGEAGTSGHTALPRLAQCVTGGGCWAAAGRSCPRARPTPDGRRTSFRRPLGEGGGALLWRRLVMGGEAGWGRPQAGSDLPTLSLPLRKRVRDLKGRLPLHIRGPPPPSAALPRRGSLGAALMQPPPPPPRSRAPASVGGWKCWISAPCAVVLIVCRAVPSTPSAGG